MVNRSEGLWVRGRDEGLMVTAAAPLCVKTKEMMKRKTLEQRISEKLSSGDNLDAFFTQKFIFFAAAKKKTTFFFFSLLSN